jgi:enoyl-[acyl-carrier protein] reductase II
MMAGKLLRLRHLRKNQLRFQDMLKTNICEIFGIEYPIIQGGMAHLATAELASAVSNAGGLGIIAAANYDAEWLREQIRSAYKSTDKPIGVNLFLPSQYLSEQVAVILEERVPVVITGAGNPCKYLSSFKQAGLKVAPVVANKDLAQKVAECGADAIIAEGIEAGGHIGRMTTMSLVPLIVDSVDVPVIAAGGIVDGRGLMASLSLGARGIQMGTRFILSDECIAHSKFKKLLLNSTGTDTVIIGTSTGRPIRCLNNQFASNYLELEKANALREELDIQVAGRLYLGVIEGNLDEGLLMIGQSVGLIKEIKPARSIILDIISQSRNILTNFPN